MEENRLYSFCMHHAITAYPLYLFSWHKNPVIKCDFCHLSNSNKWNANTHSEGPLWSLTSLSTDFRVGQRRGVGKKWDRRFLDQSWPGTERVLRWWNNSQKSNGHQRTLFPLKICAVGNVQCSLCSYHQSKWLSHYGSLLRAAPVNNEQASLNLIWQRDHSSGEKPTSP